MIAHKSLGGLKEGDGGHRAAKDCQQQEDFGSSRAKQTREDAALPGPRGIQRSREVQLRRESPKAWASRGEVLESGRVREAMPPPTSGPPRCPPLAKPPEASSRGAESQPADVTAREVGRKEQRGVGAWCSVAQ